MATVFLGLFAHKKKSKDMQRMPPTTEPLSRNALDETFVWILAYEKERRALRTQSKGTHRTGGIGREPD
jgi:hypothetical protein